MNGNEFYHNEIFKIFISKIKESNKGLILDEDQGINFEEKEV